MNNDNHLVYDWKHLLKLTNNGSINNSAISNGTTSTTATSINNAKTDDNSEKETNPRIRIRKPWPSLSNAEQEAIEDFPQKLDGKFREIAQGDFTAMEIAELLDPYISNANIVSKISTLSPKAKDRRHVNLRIAAAMRRVFGVSIDAILDDCFRDLPPRTPPKKIK